MFAWRFVRVSKACLLLTISLTACESTSHKTPPLASLKAEPVKTSDPDTEVATERFTRQISMYYRLDLQKDNAHSPAIAQVLTANDGHLRTCYTARLAAFPALAGNIMLNISLSKSSGTVAQIVQTGGSLKDEALVTCVKNTLSHLAFNPPYDMRGTLIYQFRVRIVDRRATATR